MYPLAVRVGFLVSGNKYTGAAAVAEHLARSVLAAGGESELLYVAGNNLEARLAGTPWAVPGLIKERRPADLAANLRSVRGLAARCDVVVSHLPHDHFLAVAARVHRRCLLLRNIRNPRHLRTDPYHRWSLHRTRALLLANNAVARRLGRVWRTPPPWAALPVPLEDRFRPGGDRAAWRRELGIPASAPVLGMIGKVAPGRGFDVLVDTAAQVEAPVHVLVIGHGESRGEIQALAEARGLGGRFHWAGYRERELPDLYAAMDVVLFPAPGSDHGHRAVSEAQGCGRPVVSAAIPGVEDLVQDRVTGRIVPGTPEDLASSVAELVRRPDLAAAMGERAARAVETRRFRAVGSALLAFLERLLPPSREGRGGV